MASATTIAKTTAMAFTETATNAKSGPIDSGYQYVLAYGVAIAIIIFFMKFKAGYTLIYYSLVLSLLMVLLLYGKWISDALAPIETTGVNTDNTNATVNNTTQTL